MGCIPSKVNRTKIKVISTNDGYEVRHVRPASDLDTTLQADTLLPNTAKWDDDEMPPETLYSHASTSQKTEAPRPEAASGLLSWSRHMASAEMDAARCRCGRFVRYHATDKGFLDDCSGTFSVCRGAETETTSHLSGSDLYDWIENYDSGCQKASSIPILPSAPPPSPSPVSPYGGRRKDQAVYRKRHGSGGVSVFCVDVRTADGSPPSKDSQYYSGPDNKLSSEDSVGSRSRLSWSDWSIFEDLSGSAESLFTDDVTPAKTRTLGLRSARFVRPNAAVRRQNTHHQHVTMTLTARF